MVKRVSTVKEIERPQENLIFVFRNEIFVPKESLEENAGFDFKANIKKPVTLRANSATAIPLGVKITFPPGFELQLRPRSGLSMQGLFSPNSPATIDPGYRGEIKAILTTLPGCKIEV